jgi:hypothetical protein
MNPYWLVVVFTLLTQFCIFVRWLHHRLRDAEIAHAFLRDIATHHLPHIYQALKRIAQHHGVELPEPPLVRFVVLNGDLERRRGP